MALHWGIGDVEDWQGLHNSCRVEGDESTRDHAEGSEADLECQRQWARTETLLFATMGIGIACITEKNVELVCTRLAIYQQVFGALMSIGGKPLPLTSADVHRRIGLWTNASALTDAAYRKRIWERLERETGQQVRRDLKEIASVDSVPAS